MITKTFDVELPDGQRKLINEYVSILLEKVNGYRHVIHTETVSIVGAWR